MADIKVPGQSEKGDPPRAEAIEDWGSLNTKALRPAIKPNEFSWNENFMPIGAGNLRTLWGEGSPLYTATGGKTIISHFPYNIGATSYLAVFLSDGSAVQVAVVGGAVTTIGPAATFYSGGDIPACSQYESKYLLIGSTVATNAYWVWDGASLFGAGTVAPQVVIQNSGSHYTSAPTVTAFGGSGSGSTYTATEAGGFVTAIKPTNPGSGYSGNPTDYVQLIITGGGSDDQARAHATVTSASGGVGEVSVTAGGTGYTSDVAVSFSGGGGSGAQAIVSTATNGVIVAITVTNPGSGYTSPPTVAIAGTGGTGATAIAQVIRGQITAITVDGGGTGYHGAPTVIITAPDDVTFPTIQAEATAQISGGVVTGITVTNSGAGYIHAGVNLFGGNNAANATINIMPFGLQATAIETYQDAVWTSVGTKMTFSASGSVSDFATSDGGGSTPATDSFLRKQIVALRQANGFLYRLADSSINVITNVQTSASATTTFNNSNVDAQVGTAWRDSVQSFGRAIVFANPNGVYAIYGGAAEKVSDALDGLFASATFNVGGSGVIPTASVATIFGIRVYMLLFTTTDRFSGDKRNILAMWDGQKWFIGTQLAVLTNISAQEINSILTAWGTDGTHLYPLFQTPSMSLSKAFQTKLVPGSGDHIYKQVNRAYVVAENNTDTAAVLTISLDTEAGVGTQYIIPISQLAIWIDASSQPVTWINNSSQIVTWGAAGLQVSGFQTSAYGRMLGFTVTASAADLTMIRLSSLVRDFALYG